LFANNIIIIEGLRLKEIEQGEYFMVAAPLKIVGTDGSPARVLLFEGLR
jgi:arylformamidase